MPGLPRLARSVVPAAGLLLAAATARGHEGERVFSVFEPPTADLPDLPDGERGRLEGSQAQRYAMQPESLRRPLGFGNPAFLWAAASPWTDLGSWATGSRPATAAIETELTLWDELSAEGPGSSRRTRRQDSWGRIKSSFR